LIEKIDKTVYRCTCELAGCKKSWMSDDSCPERCRWCGRRTWNGQDLRRKHLITAKGKTQQVSAWAKETGISKQTIQARLRLGWSESDAVTIPVGERPKAKE
jgi:hypothetical protein